MTTFSKYELGGTPGPGKKEPFTYKDWAYLFVFIILVFVATFVFNNFSIVGAVLLGVLFYWFLVGWLKCLSKKLMKRNTAGAL